MVEGPGCKIKGQKMKAKLKGQIVTAVSGNAVEKNAKKRQGTASPFLQLIGCQLDDVQTLGKELFMYFGEICLRVHFLMAGQSFINQKAVDKDPHGQSDTAILEVQMCTDHLSLRKCSVDLRPSALCKQKYEHLNNVDICSPVFSFTRAFNRVREQTDRQVCDVLLDQGILPGVGNIIKNEALFDSGIRPSTKIGELKDDHIHHLLRMTRDFTDIFYQCRRDGKPLHPYYKIYGKRVCGQCEGRVTICRLGDDSGRVTYFCEHCQTNDLTKKSRKLPSKNSLLSWVQSGSDCGAINNTQPVSGGTWSCEHCTLINVDIAKTCSVCLNPRQAPVPGASQVALIPNTSDSETCELRKKSSIMEYRTANSNTDLLKLQSDSLSSVKSASQGKQMKRKSDVESVESCSKLQKVSTYHTPGGTSKVSKPNKTGSTSLSSKENQSTDVKSKIPVCSTHRKQCLMKEVRKEGPNLGRWFFSCPNRACKFFEWADTKFPICEGHGKPCTLRTVMKIGPNNGRRFFACKMARSKQCKFFEWAQGYD